MSLFVKAASAAAIITTLSSFGTAAGAAPLSASLALRDAPVPRVQTIWWRGGYAYDYDYYCPPYATPYASTYYGYSSPYYGGNSYGSYYRRYSYGPRYYGNYYYGY
jgi:hypothetical protein